ncbi:AAA family ATPase, partial [Candidatus Phytoplasma pruni]
KKGCIIFIDEIDTIGTKRTSDSQASGISHNKMVNALLTLLDGMKSNDDVVVIGATNKDDLLDEALTRPGRLDRKIYVGLPDRDTKIRLYNLFLKKYKAKNKLSPNIDYERLADKSTDFSGATIAKVVKDTCFSIVQAQLKKDTVDFIVKNSEHNLVQKHRQELTYGKINENTDLTQEKTLSTYSTTDLGKIEEKIKKILYPNEEDYYVEYIWENKALIPTNDWDKIIHGAVLKDDLNQKELLETRKIEDLKKVVDKMKEYLADQKFTITEQALSDSVDKHLFGRKVLQRQYSEEEKKIVAANEAGHALLQYLQQPNLFYRNTIELSNNPTAHNYAEPYHNFSTREQLLEKATFLLAGRAAEELLIGSVSNKAKKDLEEVNKIVKEMVYNHGTADNHLVSYSTEPHPDRELNEQCNKLFNEVYNQAKVHLQNNLPLVKEIQTKLLKDNSINKATMNELAKTYPLNKNKILTKHNAAAKNDSSTKNKWLWLAAGLSVMSVGLWFLVIIIKKRNRRVV